MPPHPFRLILTAAALATLAVLAYLLRPLAPPAVDCDLNHGPCRAAIDGGELTLTLSPRPIPLLSPVRVEVLLNGIGAEAVRFELQGAEMDMGPNVSHLAAEGGGRFAGSTTIPVCITGRMRWHAIVRMTTKGRTTSQVFAFEMPNRPAASGRSRAPPRYAAAGGASAALASLSEVMSVKTPM